MIVRLLLRRVGWIFLGAAAGAALGWIAGRATSPAYQSSVDIGFESRTGMIAQASVVAESAAAVLRDPAELSELQRGSGVSIRRITVNPASAYSVTVTVQAYGEAAAVQRAADLAGQRAVAATDTGLARARESFAAAAPNAAAGGWRSLLPLAEAMFDVGLDRGRQQGRIDQQLTGRVPAPIISAVRPWYDTGWHVVGGSSQPALLQPRFVAAGFLNGIGFAILGIVSGLVRGRMRDERPTRPRSGESSSPA